MGCLVARPQRDSVFLPLPLPRPTLGSALAPFRGVTLQEPCAQWVLAPRTVGWTELFEIRQLGFIWMLPAQPWAARLPSLPDPCALPHAPGTQRTSSASTPSPLLVPGTEMSVSSS